MKLLVSCLLAATALALFTGCRQKDVESSSVETPTGKNLADWVKALEGVPPSAGFAYYSGNLNTNRSFPTIYYASGSVTVLGPQVDVTYPVAQIETAFRIYRVLCEKELAEWNHNQEELMFYTAYMRAMLDNEGRVVQLGDILKYVSADRHEKVTRMFLLLKETGRVR